MPGKNKLLESHLYLYLTEFFAGMALMAVEIGAQRLISPYFSSSQIVWTIIIGTIMIAMALGNLYGGRRADKDPNPDRLYDRIFLASLWLALIPAVGKYLIIGISGLLILAIDTHFLVLAALVTCLAVFVFPLFLLGTVTPSLARYCVEKKEETGGIVGRLGAANTIGSILGTFLPTFLTIPALGTSLTFLLFAGILLLLSLVYFAAGGGTRKKMTLGAVIFLAACVLGHSTSFAFWEDPEKIKYEGESTYNYLQVREEPDSIVLSTNVLFGVQSIKMKQEGLTGMYYDVALAAPYMARIREKKDPELLILGMGTGTYAHQCRRYFPELKITGVEIDPQITALARTYFGLPPDIPVTAYDGRAYLSGDRKKYDLIMVDAYQDITIPFSMSSVEFFQSVREHLRPGGVMVLNMNMKGSVPGSLNDYLADTVASVFPAVYMADVPQATNRELFAGMEDDLAENLRLQGKREKDLELRQLMEETAQRLAPYHPGPYRLTDDRAPVELLGMRTIDTLIHQELGMYRDILKEKGIRGVLEE